MNGPISNSLYYGDCLDWMRGWDDQTVDLTYLDPPFNSNADYNVLYAAEGGGDAQFRAFTDTWTWDDAAADRVSAYLGAVARPAHNTIIGLYRMLGECGMLAYLTYMAERLEHCQRLLKPTGSIYLHCDPTASHYLKAVMDGVFGASNYLNEITWQRSAAHNTANRYGNIADVILFYSKSGGEHRWNGGHHVYDSGEKYSEEQMARYCHVDSDGRRYRLENLTAPRPNSASGKFEWRGNKPGPSRGWGYRLEQLEAWWAAGRIQTKRDGTPRLDGLKMYLDEAEGKPLQNIWTDIDRIANVSDERMGYETQKPLQLLQRIIEASSSKGDLVLDPFCGCGTTVAAARSLDRRWAGIDISSFAVDVMLERLGDRTIPVYGIPQDLRSAKRLARDDPFGFETWAINRLAGFVPNTKQVADGGIDGRATLALQPDDWDSRLALAQVKGGKHTASGLRDFCGVTDKAKAAVGCYVTLTPIKTDAARSDAAGLGKITVSGEPYRRMNLWSIADYFDDRRPYLPQMNNPYTGKPIPQLSLF